ncbi:MAG TPA: DUF4234 domain-containing protein [Candidatus Binatia bacterium]|nr:DUF4234 domain-containing protein [Candidatus Binatia bacterium]
MKKRNPIAVFLLGMVTVGIYSWYWAVKTKGEMNKLGEKIPTAWIWLIPFVGGIWWYWKYSEAVEHVTHEKLNWVMSLIVLLLLGSIGQAIIQDFFNKLQPAIAPATTPPVATVPVGSTMTPEQPVNVAAAPSAPQMPNPTPPSQQPPTYIPPNPPVVSG